MPEHLLPRFGVPVVNDKQLITLEWQRTIEDIFSRLFNLEERQAVLDSLDQDVRDLRDSLDTLLADMDTGAPVTPAVSDSPVGVIQAFGSDTAPMGWLICDGSAVSRTGYAALFAVIGTTWGVGDGSTTFNLPDGQGRFFIGEDGVTYSVGNTGGSTSASLAHTHDVTVTGETAETAVITPKTVGADGVYTSTSALGATDITPPYFTGIWIIRY